MESVCYNVSRTRICYESENMEPDTEVVETELSG